MDGFFRRLLYYFRRRQFESDLEEEMQHHAELSGRPKFGNVTLLKEDSRAMWTWTFWEQLSQDLRYALRTMANNKAFTALAALSLALGIGANTAIFSCLDAILLRALPVHEPERLVIAGWHSKDRPAVRRASSGNSYQDPKLGFASGNFPFPAIELLLAENPAFESGFAYRREFSLNVAVGQQAGLVSGMYVTGDFFHTLRLTPAAGRFIDKEDDRTGAPAAAVISHGFWQSRFAGSADAIGQTITVNDKPVTIAGIAPAEFYGVNPGQAADLYLPMHLSERLSETTSPMSQANKYIAKNFYWAEIMARLRPGVSATQAEALLAPQFHQFIEGTASNDRERIDLPVLMLQDGSAGITELRRQFSQPLFVLMALVGLILIIACANLANLLLARAAARRREIAVRLSVGASKLRVIRQLLTESVLLAFLGGAAGIVVAIWSVRFLRLMLAGGSANFTLAVGINWRVLAVTAGLSVMTGLLFGLAPAIQATRTDVIPMLKEARESEPRVGNGLLRLGLSQLLVVSQIALSLLILIAAGLFVRTLTNYQSVEVGFNRENLLLFTVNARQAGYSNNVGGETPARSLDRFYDDLRRELASIPGVGNVSLSESPMVSGGRDSRSAFVPGARQQPDGLSYMKVGPAFFSTMEIPILLGRAIEERDTFEAPHVVVVNEVFAKTYFGTENPVGRMMRWEQAPTAPQVEIVGVARNTRYGRLDRDIPPVAYVPYRQEPRQMARMVYELRTAAGPLSYINAAREAVRRIDGRVPMSDVRTQSSQIDATIGQAITFAQLCTAFAFLALAIAGVGLYGTMAYTIARRTNEIGIRMALGAQRPRVIWMVLREVSILTVAGLAIGLTGALGATKFIQSFLFQTKPNDPLALTVAVLILVAAVAVAGYAPARRASKIDPMVALRHE